MKKLLAMLMAFALLLTFAACSAPDEEDVRGTVTPPDTMVPDTTTGAEATTNTPEATTEKEFALGTSSGASYESSFIGIGCTLSSDWVFYTDEQIMELNNATQEMLDEEYAEMVANSATVYDAMAVNNSDSSSLNIVLEKSTAVVVALADIDQILEAQLPVLSDALGSMGLTITSTELVDATIAGMALRGAKITGNISGINFYEIVVPIKCGSYLAYVTVATYVEDNTQTILDQFYAVD